MVTKAFNRQGGSCGMRGTELPTSILGANGCRSNDSNVCGGSGIDSGNGGLGRGGRGMGGGNDGMSRGDRGGMDAGVSGMANGNGGMGRGGGGMGRRNGDMSGGGHGGMGRGGNGRGRGGGGGGDFRFGVEAGMQPPVGNEAAMEAAMAARVGNTDMQRHQHDQSVFQTLLRYHDRIQRQVENLPDGMRTVTTSKDPNVVKLLHDHVPAMHRRLQENFSLRNWDPAFAEIFAQHDKVKMEVTLLPNGVLVEEKSNDPNVVKLIHAHGEVINLFIRDGFVQGQKISPLPVDYRPVLNYTGAV